MSRRAANATDESGCSVGSDIRQDAHIARVFLAEDDLAGLVDREVLGRSLTVKSVISTTSSFALRFQQAATQPRLQHLNQIGRGLQGIIFEQIGRSAAIKKELAGNDTLRSNLKHEYNLHQRVFEAFSKYQTSIGSNISVPRLFAIAGADDDEYWKSAPEFPKPHETPGTVVEMERILPLPKIIRKALISQFYPSMGLGAKDREETMDKVLRETANKHCLVRTYLGKETGAFTKERFSLRNFPLYLQSMKDFGLDTHTLSSQMGNAFAMMHWGAEINGDDVEFVLGTSTLNVPTSAGNETIDFQHRAVNFYLLDFGQCDLIDMSGDKYSVYQSFKGAMLTGDNQLFIPNCLTTPELFSSFKNAYIHAGNVIIQDRGWKEKFDAEEFMTEYQEYAEDFL